MLVDSHTHLDDPQFDKDREAVIEKAFQNGISYLISVGTGVESSQKAVELAVRYPQIYASVGVHPHEASGATDETFNLLSGLGKQEKVVAIGETGLDYYKNISPWKKQKEVFRESIKLAHRLCLPVILHIREAYDDALSLLWEEKAQEVGGVFHCFSASEKEVKEILELGFFISIAGQVTYPNAKKLREIVKRIPIEKLLLETDCPYLAPQDKRGKEMSPPI